MYTYLALGDSYTIGEQVPLQENFPFQLVKMLQNEGLEVALPVIIARTGWTTDELATAIREENIQETFSFVTLLIGVNNQYRGRDTESYAVEFNQLFQQAIGFANGFANRVFVVSIPDWGVTPFAEGTDRGKIAEEIDAYNLVNKTTALENGAHWLDITESTRVNGTNADFLAEDGLHPSSKEYHIWAQLLSTQVFQALKA